MPGLVDSTRNFGTEPQMTPGLAQGAGPYAKTASLPKLPFSGKKLAETDVCPVSRLTYPCQPLISEQRENKWLTVATVAVCLPTTPSNVVLDPYHHLYVGRESSFEMVGSLIYICNNLCKTVTAVNDEKIAKSSESHRREKWHIYPSSFSFPPTVLPPFPGGGSLSGGHTQPAPRPPLSTAEGSPCHSAWPWSASPAIPHACLLDICSTLLLLLKGNPPKGPTQTADLGKEHQAA